MAQIRVCILIIIFGTLSGCFDPLVVAKASLEKRKQAYIGQHEDLFLKGFGAPESSGVDAGQKYYAWSISGTGLREVPVTKTVYYSHYKKGVNESGQYYIYDTEFKEFEYYCRLKLYVDGQKRIKDLTIEGEKYACEILVSNL